MERGGTDKTRGKSIIVPPLWQKESRSQPGTALSRKGRDSHKPADSKDGGCKIQDDDAGDAGGEEGDVQLKAVHG